MDRTSVRSLAIVLLAAAACGGGSSGSNPPSGPYEGTPPAGTPISRTDGTLIANTNGEWTWIDFPDAFCTDATLVQSGLNAWYEFSTSATGLAINWGSPASTDVVFFLQGGGACWDWVTCGGAKELDPQGLLGGLDKTANSGPFKAEQFASDVYAAYPYSWIRRLNLPLALANATIVFIPYCTGDVHAGDKETTYAPLFQGMHAVTWNHLGHENVMAFLKRLGPTFPSPGKVIVAGSSAGGFGSLANYPAFRWYWPGAKSYLVDDSGPPLAGDAIPADTRAAWYSSWNIGASLNAFCPECQSDMSAGMRHLVANYPNDRIALLSHLQDEVIRSFYGYTSTPTPSFSLMDATVFETSLRALGSEMDPATANAKYFFTLGTGHPMLEPDPTSIVTPAPGLEAWLELMLSDSTDWASASN